MRRRRREPGGEAGRAGASPRPQRTRDALVLLASIGVVLGAMAARRAPPQAAPPPGEVASASVVEPSPLPNGATPERIPMPDPETDPGCHFPDRGFGAYGAWRPLPFGKALIPPAGAIGAGGEYDLLVHFHGAEPVRREVAPLDLGLVIAAVDAGTRSSEYARALRPEAWEALLASVDRAVSEATGIAAARARHLAVSSWSAGSGAVAQILSRPGAAEAPDGRRLDALILLDSLYGGYAPGRHELLPGQLGPYVSLAESAARGSPLFFLTHTAVPTNGYASTAETASFLLRQVGASAIPVTPAEGSAAPLVRMYDGGSLFVRGYGGGTREDHCAQLRLLPGILTEHVLPAFGRGS